MSKAVYEGIAVPRCTVGSLRSVRDRAPEVGERIALGLVGSRADALTSIPTIKVGPPVPMTDEAPPSVRAFRPWSLSFVHAAAVGGCREAGWEETVALRAVLDLFGSGPRWAMLALLESSHLYERWPELLGTELSVLASGVESFSRVQFMMGAKSVRYMDLVRFHLRFILAAWAVDLPDAASLAALRRRLEAATQFEVAKALRRHVEVFEEQLRLRYGSRLPQAGDVQKAVESLPAARIESVRPAGAWAIMLVIDEMVGMSNAATRPR